jgi:hypothetical protein
MKKTSFLPCEWKATAVDQRVQWIKKVVAKTKGLVSNAWGRPPLDWPIQEWVCHSPTLSLQS